MGLNFTVDMDFRGQAPRCSKHGQIYPADKIIAIQQIKIYWLEYILTAGLIAIYPLDRVTSSLNKRALVGKLHINYFGVK